MYFSKKENKYFLKKKESFLDSIHVQGRPTGKVIGTHILNFLDKHKNNSRALSCSGLERSQCNV